MSMHLHHPSLSLNGKKKGKVKFRNAAEAARARELDASWKDLLKSQGIEAEEKRRRRALAAEPLTYKLTAPVGRSTSNHIPSRATAGGNTAPVAHKEYTGTKMLGIGQLHKSNAVPVFCNQDAVDISKMRRG
jgi:hypothetical protein